MDDLTEIIDVDWSAVLGVGKLDEMVLDLERDFAIDTLIYTRTEADVKNNTSIGNYGYTDMNRVNKAVKYVADLLRSLGYEVTANPEQNKWIENSIPRATETKAYCKDIIEIAKVIPYAAYRGAYLSLPSNLDGLNYIKANNIEKMLYLVGKLAENSTKQCYYCGEIEGGAE